MRFEDIISNKIVIEFNNDLEKEEFKQWCINKSIYNIDFLKYSWIYYRIDSSKSLQGTSNKKFYIEDNYQIFNYKEFNINNISFKDLFIKHSVHCDTEDKAIKILQLCEDNNITWNSGISAFKNKDFYGYGKDTVYKLNVNHNLIRHYNYYNDTITYEEFIALLNNTTYKEEINNTILKDLMNKYLIRNKDFNISSADLIDFINECNDRFKLDLL